LDALQAAILRVKLRHLSEWTAARQRNAQRYRSLFEQCGLLSDVVLPSAPAELEHVYNQFVVHVPNREQIRNTLQESGIPTEIYYPSPLHLQPAFAGLGYRVGDFPEAERTCQEVLALPIYPELTEEQQKAVVTSIARSIEHAH